MNSPHPAAHLVDLYLRLSVDREGKDSLENQENDLREWATGAGLTVRKVWRDRGISGYKDVERPDFENALSALRAREVGTLAVWKTDRLSRRGAGQVGLVMDELEALGARIYFLKDQKDTSVPGDRMIIILLSEFARAESASTSIRVKAKKDKDRAKGRYLGGSAPWGYTVGDGRDGRPSDRKLRQHPDEAPLLREVVDRLLAGETMLAICRDFNARGVPTRRRGSQWRPSTLSATLRSPVLAGLQPEKRRDETSGKWSTSTDAWRDPKTGETVSLMADGAEPVVSESERLRLLDVMDSRLRRYGRGLRPVKQPKSLLGGLLVCASCGRTANTFGGSYRCRRWHSDGVDCAAPLNVKIDVIESAVLHTWAYGLAAMEPDSPVLDAVAEHWLRRYDPAPLQERADLMREIADVDASAKAADDARFVARTLSPDRYERVARGLDDRLTALRARLKELPEPEANLAALLDPEISLPAIVAASVEEARALLRLAIKRIECTAAPHPGARFVRHERVRVVWVGTEDDATTT
ncbi:recombinase family protein [Demequina maris]|uniref:recombinase family protein n=1 Tax=Demequina maris TaxID=1638982 RepID=UPI00155A280F|nr:recombinase family protein [Demequina maris]